MKNILMVLVVMALISCAPPTVGHHLINLSIQEKPEVAQLSGVSFSDFLNWSAKTPSRFEWSNPKFPKINVTDKIINKDIYTDPMYNYLHNWSLIIPAPPKV